MRREIRRRGAAEPVVLRSLVKLLRSVGAITKPERLDLVREQLEAGPLDCRAVDPGTA